MEKTIAAISTAIGEAGISVIRISGDNAIDIAQRVFKSISGKVLKDMGGYTCTFGAVYEEDKKVDECIASVFLAPHSYTGENVVEFSCHGGLAVTKKVLRLLIDNGAYLAQAGEFTKRAFLNNKIDLTQAEAVMDIISAKSEFAAKAAINIKEGSLSKKINEVKDNLVLKAAHLSAWADYPEEDIPEVEDKNLLFTIDNSKGALETLLKNYDNGQYIKNGVNTAIIGKPNVGKSTLMNLLSGFEKSIVTEIPGTTRDVVEETINLGNVVLNLADTAGIRDSEDVVEKIGVDKALSKVKNSHLIIAVFDNSKELSKEDEKILGEIDKENTIVVINKIDLENKLNEEKFKAFDNVIYMSAKNEEGIDTLRKAVEKIIGIENYDENSAMIYNERQRTLVRRAIESLENAHNALIMKMTYDAITISIEEAIDSLLELTGERVTEAVVDKVFHNFCVGK